MTRGPLPPGVYWRRRAFVLLLGATLVFVIASLLGGGSDGSDDGDGEAPAAQQAGADVDASQTITVKESKKGRKGRRQKGETQGPSYDPSSLAKPDGNCEPADVQVTPRVEEAVAGQPVTIGLSLRTVQAEACYFRIGPDKVTVKITRGGREIWTSRECPDQVPDESVVVRRAVATLVEMTWDGLDSNPTCSHLRDWVLAGDGFSIAASALGGEPGESDFELASPTPETVTVTPDPKQDKKGKRGKSGRDGERAEEADRTDEPSDTSTNEPRR